MTAPAWAWNGTRITGPMAGTDEEPAAVETWSRSDGQERGIRFLWPPEPWAPLDGPLSRSLAVCEWLDERIPPWETVAICAPLLGVLCVLLAVILK